MEESTKERIIRIGFKLMRENGYEKTTINEICQKAEISKHTFYYYFRSKEDILKGFMSIPLELDQECLSSILSMDSPLEQYLALIKPKAEYLETCGVEVIKKMLVSNLSSGFSIQNHDKKEHNHPYFDIEVSLLKKAQEKKETRNESNPIELVQILFTLLVGISQIWATTDASFPLTESYIKAVKIILNPSKDIQ